MKKSDEAMQLVKWRISPVAIMCYINQTIN